MTAQALQTVDADPGLFGPGSMSWLVNADPSLSVAGLRALLLQPLHPLAMAGVAQHSAFREDPWGRLIRTAEFVGITTFGTTEQAERAGARVRGVHRRLSQAPTIEPESGRSFRVEDPDLLTWVHVTEVESFLTVARRAGLRLTDAQVDQFYDEQRTSARLVGLDPSAVPGSAADIADYYATIRPTLQMTQAGRDAARFLFLPPMPTKVAWATPARPAWAALTALGFASLPRWARRMYRLPGLPTTDLAAAVTLAGLRASVHLIPMGVREGPHRKAARERLGLPLGSV